MFHHRRASCGWHRGRGGGAGIGFVGIPYITVGSVGSVAGHGSEYMCSEELNQLQSGISMHITRIQQSVCIHVIKSTTCLCKTVSWHASRQENVRESLELHTQECLHNYSVPANSSFLPFLCRYRMTMLLNIQFGSQLKYTVRTEIT